jgi:hypothetical protein
MPDNIGAGPHSQGISRLLMPTREMQPHFKQLSIVFSENFLETGGADRISMAHLNMFARSPLR